MLVLVCAVYFMYGSCQASKYHYVAQSYYGPKYLPNWLMKDYSFGSTLEIIEYDFGNETKTEVEIYEDSSGKRSILPFGLMPSKSYSGKWIFWDKNGVMRASYNLIKGEIVGEFNEYDEDSLLESATCFTLNKYKREVEVYISYYENGQQEELTTTNFSYSLDGIQKKWYEDGTLKSNRLYYKDKPSGLQEYWSQDGTRIKKEYYDLKGNFQKRELFVKGQLVKTESEE